jgi:hypothetical protein
VNYALYFFSLLLRAHKFLDEEAPPCCECSKILKSSQQHMSSAVINKLVSSGLGLYILANKREKLICCNIRGFHGDDYEECPLLVCYAVWLLLEPRFRRNVSPPSSGSK